MRYKTTHIVKHLVAYYEARIAISVITITHTILHTIHGVGIVDSLLLNILQSIQHACILVYRAHIYIHFILRAVYISELNRDNFICILLTLNIYIYIFDTHYIKVASVVLIICTMSILTIYNVYVQTNSPGIEYIVFINTFLMAPIPLVYLSYHCSTE